MTSFVPPRKMLGEDEWMYFNRTKLAREQHERDERARAERQQREAVLHDAERKAEITRIKSEKKVQADKKAADFAALQKRIATMNAHGKGCLCKVCKI